MNIVILGGGFCGATVAKELDAEKNIQVTLIDKNPFFEYNPSAHKCITQPSYQQNIRISFENLLSNTNIITESVKRLFPTEVHTESKRIEFDYAVVCFGSMYPIFLSSTEQVFTLSNVHEAKQLFKALKNTKKVLVVGGGYIGTEIASELATKRPDLLITLVHSNDRMIERSPLFASSYARNFLERRGVKFLFNEKVVDHPRENEFVTEKDRKIEADVCVWCAGMKTNASFLEGFSPSTIDDFGRIKVKETLQLTEYPHIFAGGDLTAINEEKTARKAELHARIISSNIKRLRQGKSLKKYRSKKSPMVISLGDTHGIGQFGRISIPGIVPGIGKWLIEWWTIRQLKK
ncbi:MAG: FAD-dependent oxidoreductase [Candidatus Thermoplasmatota archaeon]|nr:FAD-dependent oxidoreductase [Candidatus Thermoplasmatota archaeon]